MTDINPRLTYPALVSLIEARHRAGGDRLADGDLRAYVEELGVMPEQHAEAMAGAAFVARNIWSQVVKNDVR
jgi:hypothetical protein